MAISLSIWKEISKMQFYVRHFKNKPYEKTFSIVPPRIVNHHAKLQCSWSNLSWDKIICLVKKTKYGLEENRVFPDTCPIDLFSF